MLNESNLKGNGTQYNPTIVLREFKRILSKARKEGKDCFKKNVYRHLASKYNKSKRHIRKIIADAKRGA